MVISLRLGIIAGILFFAAIILRLLCKQKLNLKYILLWLAAILVMLVAVIFPELTVYISKLLDIKDITNTVFMVAGGFALLILLSMTVIVTTLTNRIYSLAQREALLDERLRRLEEKENGEK